MLLPGTPDRTCRAPGPPAFPGARLAWVALAAGAFAAPADALPYLSVSPQASFGIIAESNPRYRVEDYESATGVFTDFSADLVAESATTRLTLRPRWRSINYLEDNEDLNDDDYYLDALLSHEGLRAQTGLTVAYSDISVRTGEFESATPDDPDIDPIPGGGSGRFLDDLSQQTITLRPYLTYRLSPLNTVQLSVDYVDRDYDRTVGTSYTDYTYSSGSLTLSHALSPQSALLISLNAGAFDAERPESSQFFDNSSENYGATIGYQRAITPTWAADIVVGTTRSSVKTLSPFVFNPETGGGCFPLACRTTDQNFVGNLSLRKRAELTDINIEIGRQIAPRSDGSEVIQDEARLYVNRRLRPRLTGTLAFIYQDETAVAEFFRQSREYFSADARLSWQLTRTWTVYGSYTYRNTDEETTFSDLDTDRDNNRYFFGVTWRGNRIDW